MSATAHNEQAVPGGSVDPDLPLLAAVARGEAQACNLLVQRHLRKLHRVAMRMLGDSSEAQDVCQDVFLRAWQQAPRWQAGGAPFGSWMMRVALNLCRDLLRKRRDGPPLDDLDLSSDEPRPDRLVEAEGVEVQVHEAIAALPIRQREALLLCHFEGLGNIEAAGLLEISVEALESLLGRARRSLRGSLAPLREPHATPVNRPPPNAPNGALR